MPTETLILSDLADVLGSVTRSLSHAERALRAMADSQPQQPRLRLVPQPTPTDISLPFPARASSGDDG